MDRKEKILKVLALLKKEFKGLKTEPGKSDPLDVLIATMLSQNTTDKTSYKAFVNLKERFKDWYEVMEAPYTKVRDAIKVCGLANPKARNIQRMLKELKKEHGKLSLNHIKKMGNDEIYEELTKYNGVGVKTVSCVLVFSLARDVFPVDTHVHRVSNRLSLAHSKTPEKTFEQLKDIVPEGNKLALHTLLIRFGRKICRAKNPLCNKCPLYDLCEFEEKEYYAGINKEIGVEPKENNFIILEHV
ncbi:MAG: endonuclease III [Ignavibacteriae bacterium]|nr:MAG: endonuclease III [Ignavibacteriota bacterium]